MLLKGLAKDNLKKKSFGHNLVALLAKARTLNLEDFVTISQQDEKVIAMTNAFYDIPGRRRLQYVEVEWVLAAFKGLPELTDLAGLVTRIVSESKLLTLYRNA